MPHRPVAALRRSRCWNWKVSLQLCLCAVVFALCAQDAAAQPTLIGLSGTGGGEASNVGVFLAGTGFSTFNVTKNMENPLIADTSLYVATAFALDPLSSMLYLEKQETDGVHLVALSPSGAVLDIAGPSVLTTVFKFFVFNA